MHLSSLRRAGLLSGLLLSLLAITAVPAHAAGIGLPPGYQVQRIDSPIPLTFAGFGSFSTSSVGDVDGDGEVDFATRGTTGSLNGDGMISLYSGATGQLLRSVNAADGGGSGNRAGGDSNLNRTNDFGSCPAAPTPDPNQPGPTCPSATIGPPDGASEILVGSGGVDVGGVRDVGRVYVLDGRTLAVLKRIDMPPADRALIAARLVDGLAQSPPITNATIRGGFGRSATTPAGLTACAENGGVGSCPSQSEIPLGVRLGDTDGGGVGDVVVGANNFPESAATAEPSSHCARFAGPAVCVAAGRAYTYRGEEIVGSDPAVVLDGTGAGQTPPTIIRNFAAQADNPLDTSNRTENLGHSQVPIGDVGSCLTGGTRPAVSPGSRCPQASRSATPDGKAEYVISSHRADTPIFDPGVPESGVSFLYDGATGSLLKIFDNPEPVPNASFGFTTGQTFPAGDLGDSALPDVVLAGMQSNAASKPQSGRAYVFNGSPLSTAVFSVLDDPTPNIFGAFGNPTEGVGDLVPELPRNEVLIGGFSQVQTQGRADTLFDVSFMSPGNGLALQTISDPDLQNESGFGSKVFLLGDLNEDGFLDFGVTSPRWDAPASGNTSAVVDRGRIYIFRSDKNAVAPVAPSATVPAGPAGTAGPEGTAGTAGTAGAPGPRGPGTAAVTLAGRTVDLDASGTRVRRGARVQLRGVLEAFANPAACQRNQSVQLQRRSPTGSRFVTFKTVKTTSAGTFRSARFAATSTRFYRARVVQSTACSGDVSPRVSVSVIKPPRRAARTAPR